MAEKSIDRIFEAAAGDRRRGAAEIESDLIRCLLAAADRLCPEALRRGAEVLAMGQPAMANLRNLADRVRQGDPEAFLHWLRHRLQALGDLPNRFAANAWPLIEDATAVITISRSSAVAAVVQGAWSRGWDGGVVVLDGGAAGCGRDQARALSSGGEALWCRDEDASKWLDREGAVVVVGADAVGGRTFVNVAGTAALLTGAERHGHLRLLVADTGKEVAERDVGEILDAVASHHGGHETDPVFERVPCGLISDRISEGQRSLC